MGSRTFSPLAGRRILLRTAVVPILMAAAAGCSSPTDRGSCEPGPYFTQLPVDAEVIRSFVLLGQFNPPGDVFPRGQTGLQLTSTELTPLYAVGDIELRYVESTRWLASPTREGHVDYSLSFEVPQCRLIFGNYEHIAVLEPDLATHLGSATCEIYSTESETVEACGRNVRIPVAAGTVLGQAGGATTGLDFDLFDRRVIFDYVARQRYPGARWAICPQPLFIPALRDLLLERTGRDGVQRIEEPRCGTMEIDVAGTAQGMWVLDGVNVVLNAANFDRFFALAPDEFRPGEYNVLVTAHPGFGVSGIGPVVFHFPLESTGRVNRRFRDLPGDGTVHCYLPGPNVFGHALSQSVSFMAAFGSNGKVTLERRDHAPGESPCMNEEPEAWGFSGAAVRLMR